MPDLTSRPYKPTPEGCCEACVFGTGRHADWCPTQRTEYYGQIPFTKLYGHIILDSSQPKNRIELFNPKLFASIVNLRTP